MIASHDQKPAAANQPGLVIFDCDGVLVDSEPISIEVLVAMLAELGLSLDPADAYRLFLGRSVASICATVAQDHGLAISDRHLAEMRAVLRARFAAELQPLAGIAGALAAIRGQGLPICVASSSQPDRIRHSLAVTGLLDFFAPRIYSSTMVENGKPAPDLFLHAAAAMGVAPKHCLVVEDSPAGVTAARRAGMRVFGFTGGSHALPGRLLETLAPLAPDLIFGDMAELPGLIGAGSAA